MRINVKRKRGILEWVFLVLNEVLVYTGDVLEGFCLWIVKTPKLSQRLGIIFPNLGTLSLFYTLGDSQVVPKFWKCSKRNCISARALLLGGVYIFLPLNRVLSACLVVTFILSLITLVE